MLEEVELVRLHAEREGSSDLRDRRSAIRRLLVEVLGGEVGTLALQLGEVNASRSVTREERIYLGDPIGRLGVLLERALRGEAHELPLRHQIGDEHLEYAVNLLSQHIEQIAAGQVEIRQRNKQGAELRAKVADPLRDDTIGPITKLYERRVANRSHRSGAVESFSYLGHARQPSALDGAGLLGDGPCGVQCAS